MKYLKSYKRFKNTNKFNESVVFSVKTISSIVTPQVNKAIESLGDVKPDSVIKWIKSTIMNPKSGTFLLKNMIEELKANGSFLSKGYSGSSSESVATQFDYNDLNYYRFIQECLTNIIKHAADKTVFISIQKDKEYIVASLNDNGKGFELKNNKTLRKSS